MKGITFLYNNFDTDIKHLSASHDFSWTQRTPSAIKCFLISTSYKESEIGIEIFATLPLQNVT